MLLLGGCSQPYHVDQGGFDAEDSASRMYAIRDAGEQRDFSAVPRLIELLNASDPAERMMAINALDRITGERLDYSPYAPLTERQKKVEAWAMAYREGRLKPVER